MQEYRRQPIKEARPVDPERTKAERQAIFRRLANDEGFRAITTFHAQVLYAKDFIDEDDETRIVPTAELARFFGVNDQSIRAILKAGDAGSAFMGRRSNLTDRDFETIIAWVTEAALRSEPMTLRMIVAKIFTVLHKKVTKDCLRKALKRRNAVKMIDAKPMKAARLSLDAEQVQRYMAETEARLRNIPACFDYNMDETGINQRAEAKVKKVVVNRNFQGTRTSYPIPRDTSHSTVVACVSAHGDAIQPLVIVKHLTIRDTLMRMCWTPDKVCFAHSASGYMTEEIFLRWLRETFIPNVDERRRIVGNAEQRAYLLLDNCSSHKSDEITALCEENNIELVYFVPNSTHIFQPLDLSFFAAFKARIRDADPEEPDVDAQTKRILKILRAWDDAKKVDTIRGSFEMAGFVYDLVDRKTSVSFSRAAVRSPEAHNEEPPIPRPRGHRVPI